MNGEVPQMYWFLFWVGLSIGVLSFGFFMAIILYRGNMRALAVLKSYAEKGVEPPPEVLELLTRNMGGSESLRAAREMGTKAGNFTGLVAAAASAGAIAWWRMDQGGPQWMVYAFATSAVFFGMRAIGFLLSSLTGSERTSGR